MATSEMGVVKEAIRRRWVRIVAVLVVGMLLGAVLGRRGGASYDASATIRMQYPTNLATAPLSDDFSAWLRLADVRAAAAAKTGLVASDYSVNSAVPPANRRLVEVTVSGPNRVNVRRFAEALISEARMKAQAQIADQLTALTGAAAANARALKLADEIAAKTPLMLAKAGANPAAQAAILTLALQSTTSRSTLLEDRGNVAAALAQLNNGVYVQEGPSVAANIAGGGLVTGATRGLVVGFVIVVVWLLVATRRERAAVRDSA